jgi:hypothetical protein
MKKWILAGLAMGIAGTAQAHEVWIERAPSGAARIYLGEPERPLPEGGDAAFPQMKAPKLVPASTAPHVRGPGYIEVAVGKGDIRAWDDDIFKPWDENGKKAGATYYARTGRTETKALMPFEIVPVSANGTRFTLMRDGKPAAAGVPVTVLSPELWMRTLETDANGQVAVPLREKGRYILKAEVKDEGSFTLPAGSVSIVSRVITTSFVH